MSGSLQISRNTVIVSGPYKKHREVGDAPAGVLSCASWERATITSATAPLSPSAAADMFGIRLPQVWKPGCAVVRVYSCVYLLEQAFFCLFDGLLVGH